MGSVGCQSKNDEPLTVDLSCSGPLAWFYLYHYSGQDRYDCSVMKQYGVTAEFGAKELYCSQQMPSWGADLNGREMVTIDTEVANAQEIVFFHCKFEILMCHVCCMSHVELTMA